MTSDQGEAAFIFFPSEFPSQLKAHGGDLTDMFSFTNKHLRHTYNLEHYWDGDPNFTEHGHI